MVAQETIPWVVGVVRKIGVEKQRPLVTFDIHFAITKLVFEPKNKSVVIEHEDVRQKKIHG